MNVLFVTVEMSPLAKVGGLADVAGSLPKALVRLGEDVRVIMPLHGITDRGLHGIVTTEQVFDVPIAGGATTRAHIGTATIGGVTVYLVDIAELFDRQQVYGEPDDNLRWVAFCDAVVAWLAQSAWRPDLLHLNEWHSAFVGTRLYQSPESPFAALPRVYTIHNLAIHGGFDEAFAKECGFGPDVLESPLAWEGWVSHSGMGQGILWSDLINTVSPTYAREILTSEYGAGLDPLLRARQSDLSGILNGIDDEEFDPATDARLAATYDAHDFAGHAINKAALQTRVGLTEDAVTPLIGVVTRLFFQKGADLAVAAIDELLRRRPLQLVVLGTGEQIYHDQLTALAERHPGSVAVVFGFDAELAQQIYGGTDLFLMPSRFEPCGLGQMIALRYGSVPVVRHTGGLADTVHEWTGDSGNGFVFDNSEPRELAAALDRALDCYARPAEWQRLVAACMAADNSWHEAAREYLRLYERARTARASAGAHLGNPSHAVP